MSWKLKSSVHKKVHSWCLLHSQSAHGIHQSSQCDMFCLALTLIITFVMPLAASFFLVAVTLHWLKSQKWVCPFIEICWLVCCWFSCLFKEQPPLWKQKSLSLCFQLNFDFVKTVMPGTELFRFVEWLLFKVVHGCCIVAFFICLVCMCGDLQALSFWKQNLCCPFALVVVQSCLLNNLQICNFLCFLCQSFLSHHFQSFSMELGSFWTSDFNDKIDAQVSMMTVIKFANAVTHVDQLELTKKSPMNTIGTFLHEHSVKAWGASESCSKMELCPTKRTFHPPQVILNLSICKCIHAQFLTLHPVCIPSVLFDLWLLFQLLLSMLWNTSCHCCKCSQCHNGILQHQRQAKSKW